MNSATSNLVRVVRPRVQIARESQLVAAALILPVFAAMFWFAIPRGTWPRVIIALAFVLALYLAAALMLRAVGIRIARDGIVDVPVDQPVDPITGSQLRAALTEQLYWFESWPWVGRLTVVGVIAALALISIALMSRAALVVV